MNYANMGVEVASLGKFSVTLVACVIQSLLKGFVRAKVYPSSLHGPEWIWQTYNNCDDKNVEIVTCKHTWRGNHTRHTGTSSQCSDALV